MIFKRKLNLIWPDYLIIIGFFLMIAMHSITTYVFYNGLTTDNLSGSIKVLSQVMEANPLVAKLIPVKKLMFLYSYLFAPAVYVTGYYYMRVNYTIEQVKLASVFIFSVLINNFFNDFSALIGLLFKI